jgi:hypothetical protein
VTWFDANGLVDPPATTPEVPDDMSPRRCPFDAAEIATCPDSRPGRYATAHRSQVDCRYFQVVHGPQGPVPTCTRSLPRTTVTPNR